MFEECLSFILLVVCVSYLIMGCAKKRKDDDRKSAQPIETTPEPEQPTSLKATQEAAPKTDTLAGFQSQTSEILAGPGEEPMRSSAGSALSRHSNVSGTHHGSNITSGAHHSKASKLSRLSSHHSSKFGSTLESGMGAASRAAGGGRPSVISMLSRSSDTSNIQSTLSSQTPGSAHSSTANSTLDSAMSTAKSKAASMHSTAKSMANSMLSAMSRRSKVGSTMHSGVSSAAKSKQPESTIQQVSSITVSGSSPISQTSNMSSMHSGATSAASKVSGQSSMANSSVAASSAGSKYSARSAMTGSEAGSQTAQSETENQDSSNNTQ